MVAYSFQRQFAEPILIGRKRHTIRADRKRHARPGEALQLYIGMRTKQCQLIARATCEKVLPIKLSFGLKRATNFVLIDGDLIDGGGLDDLAYHDGFDDWWDMRAFWKARHGNIERFDGVIIHWKDMEPGR